MAKLEVPHDPNRAIAFQGEPGAYSHLACRQAYPDLTALPCPTFEEAFAAVEQGQADHAMIPIENSIAGRVADIHNLLPNAALYIVAEHFHRVEHHLLAIKDTNIKSIKQVFSHVQALGQSRQVIRNLGLEPVIYADTAGAARLVAERNDPTIAAVASELAGEIYGLKALKSGIEDATHNTTRFVVLARTAIEPDYAAGPTMTTLFFQVRNVPAALYKALGGFATNGVNITKLESYQIDASFNATQFYADIEGHPDERRVQLAMEELDFFTHKVKILGVYPSHPYRRSKNTG